MFILGTIFGAASVIAMIAIMNYRLKKRFLAFDKKQDFLHKKVEELHADADFYSAIGCFDEANDCLTAAKELLAECDKNLKELKK